MIIDPHQAFIRRTLLLLLVFTALGAGLAAFMHSRQAHPELMDMAVSMGMACMMSALAAILVFRPSSFERVVWAAFVAALFALALPAWVYSVRAATTPGASLVDSLPPISAGLLPLILTMIVFMRPRHAFAAALVAWIIVASPILFYLADHPAEMGSPRGMDMVMTLGPVMMLLLIYIPFHRNIEARYAAMRTERAKLQALAERDGLTGLYNRRASENLLANLVSAPDPADGLILFDIDHFKRINDSFGHPVGDEVLRQVARRCEAMLRRDDVLARWGGEEFLLLARGAQGEGSVRVAEALRAAIAAAPIDPAGIVTASFGVAMFHEGDNLASWIQRADEALYEAKHGGRNRVISK